MDPVPTSLAGYQLLCSSSIGEGDILVDICCSFWADSGCWGKITDEEGLWAGYRVYRKSLPPHAGDHDIVPGTNTTYGESTKNEPVPPHHSTLGLLKDSGKRRSFGTGSVRDMATGKGTPHLMPFRAFMLGALQMERGKQKYGSRNWELGQPLSSYFDSGMRHLIKHWMGWTDEPHLDAFLWNSMCYAETAERVRLGILPKELDDRPTIGQATPEEMGITT
jgi:hypothetical protein